MCLWLGSPTVYPALVAAADITAVAGIPVEPSKFELIRPPNEDDTPGALIGGGYCWSDVNVVQRSHKAVDRQFGGATVETITHAGTYSYVIHDFFGTFRGAGLRRPPAEDVEVVQDVVKEGEAFWRFVDWRSSDGIERGKICIIVGRKKEGTLAGNVGWYSRDSQGIKTVMVLFDNLDGVPAQLIDEFLKQYPSSVKEEDFHGRTWVAEDVRKWVHLLGLLHGDRDRSGFALNRLSAYDSNLFGVDRAKINSRDGAVFEEAMDDLRDRAERWLAEREANSGSANERR